MNSMFEKYDQTRLKYSVHSDDTLDASKKYYLEFHDVFVLIGLLCGLIWISSHNFLLFHAMAELFSIAVACSVFLVVWNTRRFTGGGALLLLGIAYLFIAGMDLLHTLSYKGMGVFSGSQEANSPTQLWIIARYTESLSLLAFALWTGKKVRAWPVMCFYSTLLVLTVLSVFVWQNFPDCFVEGAGLTPFKKYSEYVICVILSVAAYILYKKQHHYDPMVLRLMLAAIVMTILGELAFTFYISVYGISNLAGHIFKILSFYLIYLALVRSGLNRPQEVVFRELMQSRQQFAAAYNKTPLIMGISTIEDGTYLDINDTFVNLTGYSREEVIGKRSVDIGIITSDDRQQLQKQLTDQGYVENTILSIRVKDGSKRICRFWGEVIDLLGQKCLLAMVSDITEQHLADSERKATLDLLKLANDKSDLHELIQATTSNLAELSGCEAVGIRLREGEDFPYFETRGFPRSFVQAENHLCARDPFGRIEYDDKGNPVLECMCGNIICGRFDPELDFFTEFGSFWTNSTTQLLASTSEEERQARTRNRCNGEGYESVALIPLRYHGETFGLLQFNDKNTGRFTKVKMSLYERLAANLAMALKERKDFASLVRERNRMEAMLCATPDLFMLKDRSGKYQIVNPAFCDLLGKSEKDILDRTDYELFKAKDAESYTRGDRQVLVSGIRITDNWEIRAHQGNYWFQVIKTPVIDHRGHIDGILCSARNISDVKMTEKLLEARLGISEFATGHTLEGLLAKSLAAAEELTESRIGFFHFFSEANGTIHLQQWSDKTKAAGCTATMETRKYPIEKAGIWADCIRIKKPVTHNDYTTHPDRKGCPEGHIEIVRELVVPVIIGGDVVAIMGVGNKMSDYTDSDIFVIQELANMTWDIVTRKRAELKWRETSKRLDTLMSNLPGMVYRCINDHDWTMEYVSKGSLALTGYTSDMFTGSSPQVTYASIIHPDFRDSVWHKIQGKINEGTSFELEYKILHRNGSERWVWERGQMVDQKEEGLRYLEGFVTDITVKKIQESELSRLALAIDQAEESIMITCDKGQIQYVNPAFEKITGYTGQEVMGKNPRILKSGAQDDIFYKKFWQTLESGLTWRGRFENRKKNGEQFFHEGSVSPVRDEDGKVINYVSVMTDITEDLNLEAQLSQAQRMEAIGSLAGGIAHDFNNILFPVVGLSEMLLEDLHEDSELRSNVKEILNASLRAKDLVQQILSFSRQQKIEPQAIKVQTVAKEVLKLVRASLPTTIKMRMDIRNDCLPVLADPTKIHQVIMNLVTNAFHAMEDTGGELSISVVMKKLEDLESIGLNSVKGDNFVCLTVSDTGQGMDEQTVKKIFQPYYTTKPKGKGTGLGLSVVHGIIEDHNGCINVDSQIGQGTCFEICLPCLSSKIKKETLKENHAIKGGNERILLVDDEVAIIYMVSQLLTRMGYRVTSRTASLEALEIFRMDPDRFDLVISDLTMPNMTGDRLAIEIKRIRPDMPVIVCTGFSDRISPAIAKAMGIDGYILKPVVRHDLDEAIRNALMNNCHNFKTEVSNEES